MIEIFKTNVINNKQVNQLIIMLSNTFTTFRFHFDLEDCDKILRVEGQNIPVETIIELLNKKGYHCEIIN